VKLWSREEFPIHSPRNGPGGSTDSSLALLVSVDLRSNIGHSNQKVLLEWDTVMGLDAYERRFVTERQSWTTWVNFGE
jgi:hypothetical protein